MARRRARTRVGRGWFRDITPRVGRGDRFVAPGELPAPIRPFRLAPPKLKLLAPEGFVEFRRGTWLGYARNKRAELEARAVSLEVTGANASIHERIIYKELLKRNIPFSYQSSFFGGRRELGGMVVDFVLLDRPAGINPLGEMWHRGVSAEARDVIQNDILLGLGYQVYMVEDYVVEDEELLRLWFERWIEQPVARAPTLEALRHMNLGGTLTLPTRLNVPRRRNP